MGGAGVNPGSDGVPDEYALVLDEIARFQPLLDEHGVALIEELYPYQWRNGRIQRKYFVEPSRLIGQEAGAKLLSDYAQHEARNLTVTEISLNDYLETAAICYQAAFADDIESQMQRMKMMDMMDEDVTEMTPEQLHKQWADGRHGGMLFLADRDSAEEFMAWYTSHSWEGAHPFEIVYSGNGHGIMLYPPDEREPRYQFSVVDPFYNNEFLKMTAALIERNIPVTAYSFADAVEYCKGESYRDVNKMGYREPPFIYSDTPEEQEKYFAYIAWDPIQLVEHISRQDN